MRGPTEAKCECRKNEVRGVPESGSAGYRNAVSGSVPAPGSTSSKDSGSTRVCRTYFPGPHTGSSSGK